MIDVSELLVTREGRAICSVEQLSVASGERIAIVGSNGSGKTTLLRVFAGLVEDYEGTCRVEVGRREKTFLHQHPFLFRGTVHANVRYGERGRAGNNSSASTLLESLGIGELACRTTQNLSGGEIRLVALARALACKPRLLLLDEPLADLDPTATKTVCRALNELTDTTLVVASPCQLPSELPISTFHLD